MESIYMCKAREMKMDLIKVDENRCKRDGFCVAVCPMNILSQPSRKDYPVATLDSASLCITCGHCVAVCPHGALTHTRMAPEAMELTDRLPSPTPENLYHWMKMRRSVRAYKEAEPDRDLIKQIIDVATYAPTGHNDQPVHWLVISGREKIKTLNEMVLEWMHVAEEKFPQLYSVLAFSRMIGDWERGRDRITHNAPCLIINHADTRIFTGQSAGLITMAHLELAAHAAGLGSCWGGIFTRAAVSHAPLIQALGLPEKHAVISSMMMGYPRYNYARIPLRNKPQIQWV